VRRRDGVGGLTFWLVCHYALDYFGIALFIDQELSDSSVPCPDVGLEFLEAFNAPIREASCAVLCPVLDVHHFAVVDIVRVGGYLSEQFEVFSDCKLVRNADPVENLDNDLKLIAKSGPLWGHGRRRL
jgi:hypothetical protein